MIGYSCEFKIKKVIIFASTDQTYLHVYHSKEVTDQHYFHNRLVL
jgi:hypothetical protein